MVALVTVIQAALEWAVYSAGLFGEDPAAAVLLKPLTLAWYLGIAALIVATVQQDPIPGIDQDWLIRPIKRSSLLLAKLAFLAAVINVPMFVANLLDALANGFAPIASMEAALWKELFVFACFVVPVMALAALARNAAELVVIGAGLMVVFAASVSISAFFLGADWCPTCNSGLSWLQHLAQHAGILAGAAFILGLQYFWRRSQAARLLAMFGAIGLVLAQLPWSAAFAIEERITRGSTAAESNVELADSANSSAPIPGAPRRGLGPSGRLGQTLEFWRRRIGSGGGLVTVELPVRVAGVAADELLLADRVEVALEDKMGRTLYRGDNAGALAALLSPRPGGESAASAVVYQSLEIPSRGYRKAESAAEYRRFDLSLSLMKIVSEYKLAALDGNLRADTVGRCATLGDRNYIHLRCKTIDRVPFCYSASLVAADGRESLMTVRCVPDYRRHFPAFMEIMGFYGTDLALQEKNANPATWRDYDLPASYIKLRVYDEAKHFTRSLKSSAASALLNSAQ